jgi:hypothetical protein
MAYGQPWTQPGRTVDVESTLNVEVDPTLPAGGVTPTELSVAAKTRAPVVHVEGFNATVERIMWIAPLSCTIQNVLLVSDTATSGSDASNNYNFNVTNKTQTQDMLSAAVTTNGNEIAQFVAYEIQPDQNNSVSQGDVITLNITKNNTATNLSSADVHAVVIWTPN